MTTIQSLSLQGVRSYSDAAPETIHFLRPLTIIQGHNGSGKTTIIEALKYVTTGSLPPLADGGKSFIHDPKLESQSSTKAQIRLTFRIHNDSQAVLAIRSFQLTQTKQSRSFKALESILRVKELSDGSSRSISHRCADMDKLVPQMMGVTPAVLENVIFCHQTESDWPLSDSKSLKLKFDDIFAATRYTKALDSISKLRKDKAQSVKLMEAELRTVEAHKEQARKLREEAAATAQSIDGIKERRQKADEEIARLEEACKQRSGQAEKLTELRAAIASKESVIAVRAEESKKAFDRMRFELEGSDDSLQRSRQDQQTRRRRQEEAIAAQEERTRRLNTTVEDSDREYQELVKNIGRHEQQQAERQLRKAEISNARERLAAMHHLERKEEEEQGGAAAADRDERFLSMLRLVLERQSRDLQSHKATVAKVDAGYEESLQRLRTREVKAQQAFDFNRESGGKQVSKLKELKQRCDEIDLAVNIDQHRERQQQLIDLERRMTADSTGEQAAAAGGEPGEREGGGGDGQSVRAMIADKQRQLNALQAELLVLSGEKKHFSHQQEALTLIRLKQASAAALITKHNAQLSQLLAARHSDEELSLPPLLPLPANAQAAALAGKEYDSSVIHGLLVSEHRRVKAELKVRSDELSAAVNAVNRLKGQGKMLQDEMQASNKQIEHIRQQFAASASAAATAASSSSSASDGFDDGAIVLSDYADLAAWEAAVAACQARLDKLTLERSRSAHMADLYTSYDKKAQQDHLCPLCVRSFQGEEEEDFRARLQGVIASLRSEEVTGKVERKAAAAKRKLKRMAELSPLFHDYVRLQSTEKEELSGRAERMRREVEEAEVKADEAERQVSALSKRDQRLSEMLAASTNLSRLYGEVMETLRAVEKEREKLKAGAGRAGAAGAGAAEGAGGRELEQVSKEMEAKEQARTRLLSEVSALQERQQEAMQRREEQTRLYHQLKGKVAEAERLLEERERLQEEMTKIRQEWSLRKADNEKYGVQQAEAKEAIRKQEAEREEQRKRNAEGEAVLTAAVTSLQRDVDAYAALLDALRAVDAELGSSVAVSSQRDVYEKAESLRRVREERDNGLKELTQLKEALQLTIAEIAEIDANLDHRSRQYDIQQLRAEVVVMQRQAVALAVDSNAFLEKLAADRRQLELCRSKRAEMKGALTQLESYLKERQAELQTPLYRDIGSRYASAVIELQTTIMAVNDLQTYHAALDTALMHYHALQMREINDILREYWRSVYRGRDIDEIFIHSAVETEAGKRRNYSYSVMMRQGDTELEMRGRCSAGQRVLASLLIRLALADTFCLTAGFLALDEPTTNLDHRNIAAFATALCDIIDKRRQQSNFQLILITHDERFVEEVGRRAGADAYYRITKDPHSHYSRITKTSMDHSNVE